MFDISKNRTKPGTVLIETVLSRESLYFYPKKNHLHLYTFRAYYFLSVFSLQCLNGNNWFHVQKLQRQLWNSVSNSAKKWAHWAAITTSFVKWCKMTILVWLKNWIGQSEQGRQHQPIMKQKDCSQCEKQRKWRRKHLRA